MARVIEKRRIEWVKEYRLDFDDTERPGGGYSFDCDKDGFLLDLKRHGPRVAELHKDPRYIFRGAREVEHKVVHPCMIQCDCLKIVYVSNVMGDRCECGQWYNSAGQRLNPPSMWGEETGERFDDNGNYIGGGEY